LSADRETALIEISAHREAMKGRTEQMLTLARKFDGRR
jgi:hypothetical protein